MVNISGDVDLLVSFIIPITIFITLYLREFAMAVSKARAMCSHIAAVTLQRSQTLTARKS